MGVKKKRLKDLEKSIENAIESEAKVVKQSMCSMTYFCNAIKTCGLVLLYYVFSITLTFYNQRFIHAFKFPLSITMTHLVTKFVMSIFVRTILECITSKSRVTLSWKDYVKKIAPPGITGSLDIGLSNWSFEFITVSLYTMTKSTVIIFILLFSIVFKLEKPRISLVFVVLFIAGGLFMFTYESTQFHLLGFSLALTASFLSGLRWTLAQLVLQKHEIGLSNPIDMMYHIQPWMMITLLPLSASFEGLDVATSHVTFGFKGTTLLIEHLSILMAGAVLAFGLELSEFLLVRNTSSLTLSVSGILKEIVTLLLATVINGDSINYLNGIGLLICILGITLHVVMKAVHDNSVASRNNTVEYKRLGESVEMLLHKNGSAFIEEEDEEEIFNVKRDR